jgi:rhamnogalacturonyl hydrolase YesR
LPVSENIRLHSGYTDWNYWNGVVHLAFLEMARVLGEESFREHVLQNYDFGFKHLGYFKKLYEAHVPAAPFHQFFRLDRLDDFGALGAGLLEALDFNPQDRYKEYLEKVARYILEEQERLEDGLYARERFGYTTVWGDDLYMSVPFLVRTWKWTDEEKYLDEAIRQVELFNNYLYSYQMGLYHHCWYKEVAQHGVAFWGRVNGWVLMGQVELLKFLPRKHPKRKALIDLLLRQIVGLSRYQSGNGMWRQLMDKTDSFHETSCTAMFVYGIAKAVNEKWVPDMYAPIAVSGWKGLLENISQDGRLMNVSTGFNIKQNLSYYYNRPVEEEGEHGMGAALLAGTEIFKLKKYRDCVWC